MNKNNDKYYISTSILYASGIPHIGNMYEIILADAAARHKRLTGYDVYFQTGVDEHGLKIETKAADAGIEPQRFVDDVVEASKKILQRMNISYDRYVRTTDSEHKRIAQKIFRRLYDQGDIYKGEYEGMYCTPCESFFTESQLVDGKCPDCGREVKKAKEEAYFFRASKYADRLYQYIEEHPEFIQPPLRKNEMVNNFLKPGVQDLCVSRSTFKWGIPVDFDQKHVIYVWIDALTNYITFLGYNPDGESSDKYKKYWPADVHLVGKDILRFHTIYWPMLLMALGEPLPHQVFGHPWLLCGADKMSKSKGNVLYSDKLADLFGTDAVRYFVLRDMPYTTDGNITYELLAERVNGELANIFGNLVNRTIAMSHKYFGGIIQQPSEHQDIDDELINLCLSAPRLVDESFNHLRVSDAIEAVFEVARRANKYVDETMPWLLAKDEGKRKRLGTVLYNLLETIRACAVMLSSVMPETCGKIFKQLNTSNISWDSLKSFDGLKPGASIGEAEILFERVDIQKLLSEASDKKDDKGENKEMEENDKQELIGIEDFDKVQLRVAEVLECEPVSKADKLLKLKVRLGEEERIVVSGIAKWYKPEDLIGKRVVMVANLKPVKLRGVESFGMIIAADGEDGSARVVFAPDVPSGSEIH